MCIRLTFEKYVHSPYGVNNFQSTDEEQCSKYLEYINLLCNFAILYFDISEDKVRRMHILLTSNGA